MTISALGYRARIFSLRLLASFSLLHWSIMTGPPLYFRSSINFKSSLKARFIPRTFEIGSSLPSSLAVPTTSIFNIFAILATAMLTRPFKAKLCNDCKITNK